MNEKETTAQLFLLARTALSDESKWTQRFEAEDVHGDSRLPDSKLAVRWSLLGALAYGRAVLVRANENNAYVGFDTVYEMFRHEVMRSYPDRAPNSMQALTTFNRDPRTTFSDITAVLDTVGDVLGVITNAPLCFDHTTQQVEV